MADSKLNFTKRALNTLRLPPKGKRVYVYDSRINGLGIALTANGVKTFIVYRKINGRPERVTLGRYPDISIEQARKKAAEINLMIASGDNPNDKRRALRAELTLVQLFNEYIERHAKLHKKTWHEDQKQFQSYLSHWSNRKLSSIRKTDIQKLHHEIGKDKGHYAANRLLALLSVMFNKGIEFGLYAKINPAQGIKKFKEKSRDRFLQSEELPRFFKALADESNDIVRDYFIISLLTGARRANVLAMKWEQLNLEQGEWRIPETKNGTPQIITLSEEVLTILRNRKLTATSDFVFPGVGRSGHFIEPKKGWQRILNRAGLTNLRIHDLRRTLGSWQAKTGASLAIIGKSLNHKSPTTTAIYARLDLDPVRESIGKATSAMLAAAGIKPDAKIVDLKTKEKC